MVYFDSIHKTMVYYAHLETLEILALIYILILSRNESENKKLTFHVAANAPTPPQLTAILFETAASTRQTVIMRMNTGSKYAWDRYINGLLIN